MLCLTYIWLNERLFKGSCWHKHNNKDYNAWLADQKSDFFCDKILNNNTSGDILHTCSLWRQSIKLNSVFLSLEIHKKVGNFFIYYELNRKHIRLSITVCLQSECMFTSVDPPQHVQVREIPSIWLGITSATFPSHFPVELSYRKMQRLQCESMWIRASANCYICKYKYIMVRRVMQLRSGIQY